VGSPPLITNQKENDFNEIDLNKFREKLKKELNQSKNVSIEQQSNSFIKQIFIRFGKFFSIRFEIFQKKI
jgi:hypothetical protein